MSSDDAPARLRELTDFAAPWAVRIAATLRLPDHVEAGVTRLEDLAERAGADPDSLRRLLRYLVARGLFAETSAGYANTDLSRLLVEELGWRPWVAAHTPGAPSRSIAAASTRSQQLPIPSWPAVRAIQDQPEVRADRRPPAEEDARRRGLRGDRRSLHLYRLEHAAKRTTEWA